MAGYNIIQYFDSHGYPNLLTTTRDKDVVLDELFSLMGTFWVGGDNYATLATYFATGLDNYLGMYSTLDCQAKPLIFNITDIKTTIDDNRIGALVYYGNVTYGSHYVVFCGYSEGSGKIYYVISDDHHDNYTWRLWTDDVSTIGELFFINW